MLWQDYDDDDADENGRDICVMARNFISYRTSTTSIGTLENYRGGTYF